VTEVDHVRLFRNHPELRWTFRVHEQILPAVRALGGEVRWSDVVIQHRGYQDPALRRQKLERDLRLLHMEDADNPDNPFTLFNFGSVSQELGRYEEALGYLQRSLQRSQPSDSIVRKLFASIAHCQRKLGRLADAQATCARGRSLFADDRELLLEDGLARFGLKDLVGARCCLERLVKVKPGQHFASVDTGMAGYLGRHNLAVVCAALSDWPAAESHCRAALADRPDYLPSLVVLGDVYLKQNRLTETESLIPRLSAIPGGAAEAQALRARKHLAAREFTPARQSIEELIARQPEAVWPRVLLTHILLQEGRDWPAAEKSLRDVLALDPNHPEARQNLQVLLRQQGRQ
jgi:tetratricopeptide (TPR) repeat protein